MGLKYYKNKAFSLLEVILAVSILSIGIVAILQVFSYSIRVTGLSCDIINAIFLTEDKMQDLEFQERKKLLGNLTQKSEQEGKFKYSFIPALDTNLNLYNLTFNISWQRANREEGFYLNTYLRNETQ